MNIFATHPCPYESANYLWKHDFKRANKMILESTQLLCTALNILAGEKVTPYKSTHINHPCSMWTRESIYNMIWLYRYVMTLCDLFSQSKDKYHKCSEILVNIWAELKCLIPPPWPDELPITPFVNCARNTKLGLDFTHMPVHTAYIEYLKAKWKLEEINDG